MSAVREQAPEPLERLEGDSEADVEARARALVDLRFPKA
jgi:hypothetical protein